MLEPLELALQVIVKFDCWCKKQNVGPLQKQYLLQTSDQSSHSTLTFFITHQAQFGLLIYSFMWSHLLEHGQPTRKHILKEN